MGNQSSCRQTPSTLKKLLQAALLPVGKTMYVWGGGWGEKTPSSEYTTRIGVSPTWEAFFKKQDPHYDYTKTKYRTADGLDCSAYIGWCVYNVLHTKNGKEGFVVVSHRMGDDYAQRGWGTNIKKSKVKDFRAGDIMNKSGHVYLVLGPCKDKSVVLLHASPPGVQIAATATPAGDPHSQAAKLAEAYMKTYFCEWYERYGVQVKDESYLTDYDQMRWDISGTSVMSDPDGYRNQMAEAILKDLFRGQMTPCSDK